MVMIWLWVKVLYLGVRWRKKVGYDEYFELYANDGITHV